LARRLQEQFACATAIELMRKLLDLYFLPTVITNVQLTSCLRGDTRDHLRKGKGHDAPRRRENVY
jgi:hypothetical protein